MKTEKENKLPFLNVEYICEQDKLTTAFHLESTFIDDIATLKLFYILRS